MPCYHPRPAWRGNITGAIYLGKEERGGPGTTWCPIPCGTCSGCIERHALGWALRCYHENQQHQRSAWIGLTYNAEHLPITLSKYHLQLFLKRLRRSAAAQALPRIRFFASGEYGPQGQRPHYHIIAFGLNHERRDLVEHAWTSRNGSIGHISIDPVNTKNICYTAGYTDKKFGDRKVAQLLRVDPDTGEEYTWQPPFIQMSRRPGIGAHVKQWAHSWRDYGILDGTKTPVPRFFHEAWEAIASPEEKKQQQERKRQNALTRNTTPEQLKAMEKIAHVKHQLKSQQRKLA